MLRFMESALPGLEKRDYAERYAWYSANPKSHARGAVSLFAGEGSLNRLGKFYASI